MRRSASAHRGLSWGNQPIARRSNGHDRRSGQRRIRRMTASVAIQRAGDPDKSASACHAQTALSWGTPPLAPGLRAHHFRPRRSFSALISNCWLATMRLSFCVLRFEPAQPPQLRHRHAGVFRLPVLNVAPEISHACGTDPAPSRRHTSDIIIAPIENVRNFGGSPRTANSVTATAFCIPPGVQLVVLNLAAPTSSSSTYLFRPTDKKGNLVRELTKSLERSVTVHW